MPSFPIQLGNEAARGAVRKSRRPKVDQKGLGWARDSNGETHNTESAADYQFHRPHLIAAFIQPIPTLAYKYGKPGNADLATMGMAREH